jgi:DNA (cytosine-5)-methyltransferase 1
MTLPLEARPQPTATRKPIAELFAGIGCVTRAFEDSGRFISVALVDNDARAKEAYEFNYGIGTYIAADVFWMRPEQLKERLNGKTLSGLLGCPPCQGYSAAGSRDRNDFRNRLVGHFFRFVEALEPEFFVIENVPGLLSTAAFKKRFDRISQRYRMWGGVLNAALYGVAQTRQRAIVIGYHRDLGAHPAGPTPTHFGRRPVFEYSTQRFISPVDSDGWRLLGIPADGRSLGADWLSQFGNYLTVEGTNLPPLITVGEAIGDLTFDRSEASGISNHTPWRHRPEMVQRVRTIPEGGVLYGATVGRSGEYYSQAYGRLHRDGLARTITTNYHNAGSGRFLHYQHDRTLTNREAARLQGIPDSFVFPGEASSTERLIGNAFPAPMAVSIARGVASQLDSV